MVSGVKYGNYIVYIANLIDTLDAFAMLTYFGMTRDCN